MKKIIVVFNGVEYPNHAIAMAIQMAKEGAAYLHAMFMEPLELNEALQYPFPNDLSATDTPVEEELTAQANTGTINANMQLFKDECSAAGVSCGVDDAVKASLKVLTDQSMFADLIIADAQSDLGKYTIEDMVTDARCPVVLVPRRAKPPQKIILAYDGSASSIYAIKLFSYLLPEWRTLPVAVVSVNPQEGNRVEHENYFIGWLAQHFTKTNIYIAEGSVENELVKYVRPEQETTLVVMGAYGRSGISRLLNQSTAKTLIDDTDASFFIAHT